MLIMAIKRKVKTRRFQRRIRSLAMVRAVVGEISGMRLEWLVNASTFESLGKMKQQFVPTQTSLRDGEVCVEPSSMYLPKNNTKNRKYSRANYGILNMKL